MKRKYRTTILIILAAAVIALLAVNLRSLRIAFHIRQRMSVWNDIHKGVDGDVSEYFARFCAHQDALVRLGYFEHDRVRLQHVEMPSDALRDLYRDLNDVGGVETSFWEGREEAGAAVIDIWGTPQKVAAMRRIIVAHEVPLGSETFPSLTERDKSSQETE